MPDPIVEQIAQWLLTALGDITVAGGYQQTLAFSRSIEKFLDGEAIGDLDTLLAFSAENDAVVKEAETFDKENPITIWWQRFDCFVHVVGTPGVAIAQDNRISRIVADIHKRMGVELAAHKADDVYCGALAQGIDLPPWAITTSPIAVCTVVIVPIRIKYTVLTRDPYSQPSS
jgi:hypothetical protein